jgi:hypothetical protein
MESERSKEIAAHIASLRQRGRRLEDGNLQAIADICEWQQEQLDAVRAITGEDDPDAFWTRCDAWTAEVKGIVETKFAEINKLIVHDREAFEVIFKNYFELKQQLDFLQRSLEVAEATLGIDLAGEKERQSSGTASHRCIRDGEIHPCPSLACSLCRGQEYSEEAHQNYKRAQEMLAAGGEIKSYCERCVSTESRLNNLIHEWMKEARIWAMSSGVASEHREAGIRRCIRDLSEKILDKQPPEDWEVEPPPLADDDLEMILGALDSWEQEYIGSEARALLESLIFEVRRRRADELLHPTGRCTCGGEGECVWCLKPCPGCGEKYIECQCEVPEWRHGAPKRLGCYEVEWTDEPPGNTSFLVVYMDRAGTFFGVCKNWVGPGEYDDDFKAKIVRHRRMTERSSDGT